MKKTLSAAVMMFLAASMAQAAPTTAPAVADALAKLNLKYYSPAREGLKKYECEVHNSYLSVMAESFKNNYGEEDKRLERLGIMKDYFAMEGDKFHLDYISPAETGDAKVDRDIERVERFSLLIIRNYGNSWISPAGLPNFTPKEIAQNNYEIRNTAKGYDVVKTKDKKTWTFSFTPKGVLTKYVYLDNGKMKRTMTPTFTATPKGLMLSAMADEESDDKFTRFIKMHYQEVEGFQLPVTVEYREHTYNQKPDEKDFELVLTFDDFKINK